MLDVKYAGTSFYLQRHCESAMQSGSNPNPATAQLGCLAISTRPNTNSPFYAGVLAALRVYSPSFDIIDMPI